MDMTPLLSLPYIMPSQAQKHVTHNEAIRIVDALAQLAVTTRSLSIPPHDPPAGTRYIVAAGASGEWNSHEGQVADWTDGAWSFHVPQVGWLVWVEDEQSALLWDGSLWIEFAKTIRALGALQRLGIGTTADATNPFAAKLNKALWTARTTGEGGDGDLRYTLNKEGTAHVLSLLFQSNWSGRAEFGLIGNNDFALKASSDGSDWHLALVAAAGTGKVRLPQNDVAEIVVLANQAAYDGLGTVDSKTLYLIPEA